MGAVEREEKQDVEMLQENGTNELADNLPNMN
eukprot:CAMPEP_0116886034 /NCGR_PEP_ID=MMETSP0463-20121206/19689_1 /TAXON_ID=181622 /ORGANISM="Strombidinopsis sp, Strain SopsisLIS2011" /LENGTH=31 /DNA_ID= /DNA_START= /DNA_END= /DNA_ORIENTATION=